MSKKIYLDLNVYFNINKTSSNGFPRVKEMFKKSQNIFYYSHGIAEELIGMNHYDHILKLVDEITNKNAILPVRDRVPVSKKESIEQSVQRCLKDNTKEEILEISNNNFVKHKQNREINQKKFSKEYAKISSKNKYDIWKTEIVKNGIQNYLPIFNKAIKESWNQLFCIPIKELSFDEIIQCADDPEVPQLIFDPIIELLSNILNDSGYGYDKDSDTNNSGIYDVSHLNMARYCDLILTSDKRFQLKGQAIYSLLNISTEIILIKNCDVQNKGLENPKFSNEDEVINELKNYI